MARRTRIKGAYTISVVAEQFDIHPQTLRMYEREGLLKPSRTEGNTRMFTEADMERLAQQRHTSRFLRQRNHVDGRLPCAIPDEDTDHSKGTR